MTADSDDVADSTDQKPKGSLQEHDRTEAPAKPEHPTGEARAEENKANDPPA